MSIFGPSIKEPKNFNKTAFFKNFINTDNSVFDKVVDGFTLHSGTTASVQISGYSTDTELVSNGTVTKTGSGLSMGAFSSVVYKQ